MTELSDSPLKLVRAACCVCEGHIANQIASGYDYEYWTSRGLFHVDECLGCGTVFLNPRPDVSEFARIYPSQYHTLEFTDSNYSWVFRIRSKLEARRLLRYCVGLPSDARILDVGCGDGFHMSLLRRFGQPGWRIEGVDVDHRAVEKARSYGLPVHLGELESVDLEMDSYDLVYTIQTLEHVAHPDRFLKAIHRLLKPGGRLVVVTDNTGSVDFTLFRNRYWGGYHFPRHWYLFNERALGRLAAKSGYEVEAIETIVSPVNWVYSIHNSLVGLNAPEWLVRRFTLKSPVSLAVFTLLDIVLQKFGRGGLLNGHFTKLSSAD